MRGIPFGFKKAFSVRRLVYFFLSMFSLTAVVLLTASSGRALESLHAGMKGPDISLKGMDGQTKEFADVKGEKLTILLFWSTWSTNSEKALKQMEQLYNKYKGEGLSVVAIDVDGQEITKETLAQIKAKLDSLKIDLPVSIDYGLVAFHDYGVIAVPSTVILDKNRVIKYELPGFPIIGSEEMADYIASNFGSRCDGPVGSGKTEWPE